MPVCLIRKNITFPNYNTQIATILQNERNAHIRGIILTFFNILRQKIVATLNIFLHYLKIAEVIN
jgi:hypothetical protein